MPFLNTCYHLGGSIIYDDIMTMRITLLLLSPSANPTFFQYKVVDRLQNTPLPIFGEYPKGRPGCLASYRVQAGQYNVQREHSIVYC